MKYVSYLKKEAGETWPEYRSRLRLACLRRLHPKYREQFKLEKLVGPVDCWDQLVQYQFNILTGLGLKPTHSILDVGCGPLTVGLKLISYLNRGAYVGLDVRPQPLVEAYRLVAKNGLVNKNPQFIQSESFGKDEIGAHSFDFIWMSQLSCHLDDASMSMFFERAKSHLKNDGLAAFDIMDPGRVLPASSRWAGFSFHIRPMEFYANLAAEHGFRMQPHGRIVEFGYPKRIDLHTNIILTFRKAPILNFNSDNLLLKPNLGFANGDTDHLRANDLFKALNLRSDSTSSKSSK